MQIGSSLAGALYCDAYNQYGLRAGAGYRQENDGFALANKNGARVLGAQDTHSALSAVKEEQSLLSSRALKAPTGVNEAGMDFSYLASSTTLSISEAAWSLFQSEKETAVSNGAVNQETEKETLPGLSSPMGKEGTDKEKTSEVNGSSDVENGNQSEENENDPLVKAEINQLKQREKEVIAHEAAHKAVGGQYTGAVSYTYTTGPDDKKYISGGEVSIRTPSSSDPEEVLRMAEMVRRAALAPANPSSQDIAVAADASQRAANARSEIAKLAREEAMTEQKERAEKMGFSETKENGSAKSLVNGNDKTNQIDLSNINIAQGQKALKAYSSQSNFFQRSGEKRFSAIG